MKAIISSRVVWTAAALLAAYISIVWLIDYTQLAEILNGVRFVLAVLVVVAYAPLAYEAIQKPPDRLRTTDHLVLGICVAWSVVIFNSVWGAAGRYFDFEVGIGDSEITGGAVWYTILAAILHLSAPSGLERTSPVNSWRTVGLGIAAGCLIGFLLASAWWKTTVSP